MNNSTIGVVVARFEVATLTPEYRKILDDVLAKKYLKNIIIVGVAATRCTKANPLDFEARRLMLEEAYRGKFNIYYINDMALDTKWSDKFDDIMQTELDKFDADVFIDIYASKDRFYDHYCGKLFSSNYAKFIELTHDVSVSEAEQRRRCAVQVKNSAEWRAGVIYATQNRYPTVFSTVDVAIFGDLSLKTIYLARKPNETLLRFVGGFLDPADSCIEDAVVRETMEETGLTVNFINNGYVCSQRVDDWRYRNECDKILTHLYAVVAKSGRPVACDDIAELHLKEFDRLTFDDIVPEHRLLLQRLRSWRNELAYAGNAKCVSLKEIKCM